MKSGFRLLPDGPGPIQNFLYPTYLAGSLARRKILSNSLSHLFISFAGGGTNLPSRCNLFIVALCFAATSGRRMGLFNVIRLEFSIRTSNALSVEIFLYSVRFNERGDFRQRGIFIFSAARIASRRASGHIFPARFLARMESDNAWPCRWLSVLPTLSRISKRFMGLFSPSLPCRIFSLTQAGEPQVVAFEWRWRRQAAFEQIGQTKKLLFL